MAYRQETSKPLGRDGQETKDLNAEKKLFVGGLNPQTTGEDLRNFYNKYGNVVEATVMKDNISKKSRGFGFVTFDTIEAIDAAQDDRPHVVNGKEIDSKRAIPRDDTNPESRFPAKKIFVGGLRRDVTKDQLEDYFGKFGKMEECLLIVDKVTGASKGYAFITYDKEDTVDKVLVTRPHLVNDSRADVRKALSKEDSEKAKIRKQPGTVGPPQTSVPYGGVPHYGYNNEPAYDGNGYGHSGGWNQNYYQQPAPSGQGYGVYGTGYGQDPNATYNTYQSPAYSYGNQGMGDGVPPSGGYGGNYSGYAHSGYQGYQAPPVAGNMNAMGGPGAPPSGIPPAAGFGNYSQQQGYTPGPMRSAPTSAVPPRSAPYQSRG